MKRNTIYLLLIAMVVASCGGSKGLKGSTNADKSLSTKNVVLAHDNASQNFSSLAARLQVVYEDESKLQSITVSLRMEKDKTIWIKASLLGITIAKVLITKDRVSYFESIGNTYFDGDFSLLSEWLGTEIDFEKAQAILLGQSIFSLNASEYDSKVVQNNYQLFPKEQPQNFIHYLFLNPKNFKVVSGSLSQPNDSRLLSIRYGEYEKIENNFFPTDIFIHVTENDKNTKIELNYKKIELNVSVSFPFTIPEGYEKIQL
jgi:hypothetical protein